MKSLLQMVQELQRRVDALEKRPIENAETTFYRQRVLTLEAEMRALASKPLDLAKVEQNVKQITRAMCPKCGVKPNHFFHVKWCGQQKEEKNGEDAVRRRDSGTT